LVVLPAASPLQRRAREDAHHSFQKPHCFRMLTPVHSSISSDTALFQPWPTMNQSLLRHPYTSTPNQLLLGFISTQNMFSTPDPPEKCLIAQRLRRSSTDMCSGKAHSERLLTSRLQRSVHDSRIPDSRPWSRSIGYSMMTTMRMFMGPGGGGRSQLDPIIGLRILILLMRNRHVPSRKSSTIPWLSMRGVFRPYS
jgi:hypothetical protein